MALTTGATVLDIGCGPGVDTMPLAELVGNHGKVIGIDSDDSMLIEAKQATEGAAYADRIDYLYGSALDLPLADACVAASRAERLLQVLPPEHEQAIVSEMVRVTQIGGRVVLVDTDWASASVDFSNNELERRLMQFFTRMMRPNGLAGRHFPSLCLDQGLTDLRIDVIPLVQYRFDDTPFGNRLIDTAGTQGIITEAEAQLWLSELRQRDQEDRFYSCVNMVVASGGKS